MQSNGPVAVTGMGVISSNAIGVKAFSAALKRGESGIRQITECDTCRVNTHFAASVVDFDPTSAMEARDVRRVPRMVPFAVAATREAIEMSGLPLSATNIDLSRNVGVSLGTGGGGLHFVEAQYKAFFSGAGKFSPFSITSGTHGNLSSEISIQFGLRGSSHVVSTGCTSSTDAIGYAAMLIQNGRLPVMVAGGADAPIAEGILHGFEVMQVLAKQTDPLARACRPFSLDRDGLVLGEGAWMFVLEDMGHARKRGAKILAEIHGWGSTCDAFHRVQPAPDCTEGVRAIELALAGAGVSREAIEYVNLHGTSTQLNDALETLAMKKAFGERAYKIPMSATKSMIGHPQGACGAAGLAATILSLREGFIHPTTNYGQPDPSCDLNYTANFASETRAQWALCNCIAFGSKNSALVVRVHRPDLS